MAGREGKENVVFIMKKSLPVRVTIFLSCGVSVRFVLCAAVRNAE